MPHAPVSPEEYLEFQRQATEKHELVNGIILARSGVRLAHSRIASNLMVGLGTRIGSKGCEVHGSDLRVAVSATGLYAYPDITVVCGKPDLLDEHFDSLLNPTLIVEILSPFIERFDPGSELCPLSRSGRPSRVCYRRPGRTGSRSLHNGSGQLDLSRLPQPRARRPFSQPRSGDFDGRYFRRVEFPGAESETA